MGLVVGIAGLIQLGCSGSNSSLKPETQVPSGSLALFGGDYPLCDVISFQVTITGATLTPESGGTPVSILSSSQPITVDFARLVDFTTLLDLSSVPEGNYSQFTMTLSDPQLTVLNTSVSPPVPVQVNPTTLTTSTPSTPISPPLVVSTTASAGLAIDFSLRKSVQTDSNGQVTGTVDPVMVASPTATTTGQTGTSIGDLEDLPGIVQCNSTAPPCTNYSSNTTNSSYTGYFNIQTYGGVGPIFTINVTSSTQYGDGDSLSALSAGTFVKVDGYVDGTGDIVAQGVEVEEQTSASNMRAAFAGQLIAVSYDTTTGNATQATLLVGEEFPHLGSAVPRQSPLTVTLTSSTRYRVEGGGWANEGGWFPPFFAPNAANISFGASTLGVGQEVVVHGTLEAGTPLTLTAKAVYLDRQTILGNFTKLLAAGQDGKSGGFTLQPCGLVFRGTPLTILTFADTHFSGGLSDLMGLGTQPTLAIKGLLFYQQAAPPSGGINGVTWTPPAFLDEAKQVHQLPQ
jgi:hypothetical protein